MKIAPIFALFSLATGLLAVEPTYYADFAEAQALAKKEGKDLLLEFTGLDWCDSCQGLRSRVFEKEAFQEWMGDDFLWVELNFPLDATILASYSDELKEQNQALRERYPVVGYPTIYLCDSEGRPFARRGGFDRTGTPDEYILSLATLAEAKGTRDAAFQKARALKGAERNAALAEALSAVPLDCLREFYPRSLATLEKETPEAEVVKAFHSLKVEQELEDELKGLLRDGANEGLLARVSELVDSGSRQGAELQKILMFKARAETAEGDYQAAAETITQIAKINMRNNYGRQAARMMQELEAQAYRERKGVEKDPNAPPRAGFNSDAPHQRKKDLPGESPALVETDFSTLSIEGMKSSLGLTKEEIARITKVVADEHRKWEILDERYRKVQDDPQAAKAYRAAIVRLKSDHDKNHAVLAALEEQAVVHQEAVERWYKIKKAERDAQELLDQAEELRKKAEEAKTAES